MITEEAEIEKEIDESGKFREDIHEVMIKINCLLISTAKPEPKVVDTTSGAIKKGKYNQIAKTRDTEVRRRYLPMVYFLG